MEDNMKIIGESLSNFQAALNQNGISIEEFISENYSNKWLSDEMISIMQIRTSFVNSMNQFLVNEGLINIEKVMLSILTDPLAHDIEHTPVIKYKGHTYLTTHSMIYNKFLACSNPKIKGVFIDSPNIRLELESPNNMQRGRYLVDFSQMDLELRRNSSITIDDYYNKESMVTEALNEDMKKIKNFFERMIIFAVEEINKRDKEHLKNLNVVMEVPKAPFPSFYKDEGMAKHGSKNYEVKLGEESKSQFFWLMGLKRENYDLIYPYLIKDGSKIDPMKISSKNIFNYDMLAKSINAKTGKHTDAIEVLSGAIREWLYEPIVQRIIDNKVLSVKPVIKNNNIDNIEELGGYGPFLYFVSMKDKNGKNIFPDTMGGGIGIERSLYALLKGDKVKKIDDITYFGKNPDSHPLYLF